MLLKMLKKLTIPQGYRLSYKTPDEYEEIYFSKHQDFCEYQSNTNGLDF